MLRRDRAKCHKYTCTCNQRVGIVSEDKRLSKSERIGRDLLHAVRLYVDAFVVMRGRSEAATHLDVSRHTLWRFLDRRHTGHAVPQSVIARFGQDPQAIDEARYEVLAGVSESFDARKPDRLSENLRRTLLLLCSTPLTSVEDLSYLRRIPKSTLRDRLRTLASYGFAGSLQHRLSHLGPRPQLRWYPTQEGIRVALGDGDEAEFLRLRPVSRQWFRLLAERLDSIAVIYYVASLVAIADEHLVPVRVDYYRSGPYDALLTTPDGRSIGIIRQGPMLPPANFRYRLRSIERMGYYDSPKATLVLTQSNQATRRALRLMTHGYHDTFVATEASVLGSPTTVRVWQRGGILDPREQLSTVIAHASLEDIVESLESFIKQPDENSHIPNFPIPGMLYDRNAAATMPAPEKQLHSSLSVQLTRAEKDALDMLANWPLSTTNQLAGLLGGVTKRRVNQTLQSLRKHSLIHTDGAAHVLSEKALRYLARRDRVAVGQTLDRWSAEFLADGALDEEDEPTYFGTALRTMEAQPDHHSGITDFAATLSAKAKLSRDYDIRHLLPTSRSQITYSFNGMNHVLMPDASFQLAYQGKWHTYFLEFERRATTLKRVTERLRSYIRYFESGYAKNDHGGKWPRVLFVFESETSESNFMLATRRVLWAPFFSSATHVLAKQGALGESWKHTTISPAARTHFVGLQIG